MDAVEITTKAGRPVAMVIPYPFPFASFQEKRALREVAESARSFRFPYLFVISTDHVVGWSTRSAPRMFFNEPTRLLLKPYVVKESDLSSPWVETLSSLARHWFSDLQQHWRSKGGLAPGEEHLPEEFLELLQSDEGTVR